jgi:cytochrome bd ubiquinol oxidase subunit I
MVRLLAIFQVVGVLLAYAGYRWWEFVLPSSVRAIFLGSKALLPALTSTRHLILWALAAYLLVALFALAAPKLHRWPTAVVAMLVAFAFFGGFERLREGSRKPFVIRDFMFSNGIRVSEIADLDQRGVLAKAGWAARGSSASVEAKGRAVFRAECASCHTLDGYLSIRKLVAPVDPDMLKGILGTLHEEGKEYASGKYSHQGHVATEKLDYPLMPPLVGTDEEQDALAAYLLSLKPSHVAEASHAN